MVILTDGNQTGTDKVSNVIPLSTAIKPIHALGVKVIAIGIGSVDYSQMEVLVKDKADILTPRNFTELLSKVKETISKSCRGKDPFSGGC